MEKYTDYPGGAAEETPAKPRGCALTLALALLTATAVILCSNALLEAALPWYRLARLTYTELPGWMEQQIIPIDGHSRRGESLEGLNNIVIHYVGNPGTTAQQNHDWYENPNSTVSSHFLVGLEGEVILSIPLQEKSSATNWRNRDTISIEVCHRDESGEFSDASYDALVRLTAWLAAGSGMDSSQVIRHYDVTGKDCPRYFVRNPQAWEAFLEDVDRTIQIMQEETP